MIDKEVVAEEIIDGINAFCDCSSSNDDMKEDLEYDYKISIFNFVLQ